MSSSSRTRRLFGLGWVAAGLLGAAVGASAQTGTNGNRLIGLTAEPQSETTSYTGSGSFNFVSFKVVVANQGGNVVNGVSFQVRSRVLPAGASDQLTVLPAPPADWPAADAVLAPFDSVSRAGCTVGPAANVVTCAVGQMRPGDSLPFVFFFASPTRTGDPGIVEKINLQWAAAYSDASNGERADSGSGIADAPIAIEPYGKLTDEFKSSVPLAGATLSTGSVEGNGLPQPADPWTTTVVLPGQVKDYKQARGTERRSDLFLSSDLIDRRTTELEIPDTNYRPAKIFITLRRDFSTIRKGSKITNSVVYYTKLLDPNADPASASDFAPVPLCSEVVENGPYQAADPATGILQWRPCIRTRTATPNKKVVNGKSEGYWEWVLEAYENGRYIN